MITDTEIARALEAAGAGIEIPTDGAKRILALTERADAPAVEVAPQLREPRRRRGWIFAAGGLAVVSVTLVALLVAIAGSNRGSPRVGVFGTAVSPDEKAAVNSSNAIGAPQAPVLSPPRSAAAASGSANNSVAFPRPTATPAKIASSGTLRLIVTSRGLEHVASSLGSIGTNAGGYVSSTNVTTNSSTAGGTVELAVPAQAFTTVISSAQRLGRTTSLVTRSADVTKQYADTAAQLQALGDVRAQLEALLQRTGKVSDLLAVEQQIEQVQSQIDTLGQEQSSLAHEVTYATLVVVLKIESPQHRVNHASALDKAWEKAVSGFTGGFRWIVAISGIVLFVLVLALIAAIAMRLFVRRLLPRLRRYLL